LELEDDTHTARHWEEVLDRLIAYFIKHIGRHNDDFEERLPLALLAIKEFPRAKRAIIERGRPAEDVQRMPVAQVLLIDAVHNYRVESDRAYKRFYLPYNVLAQGTERFATFDLTENRHFLPLQFLLPAVGEFHFSGAQHERRIGLLRVVEAIRHYAAGHENHLPNRLDDELGMPIPRDPVTGNPFNFRIDAETAVIEALPPLRKTPREGGAKIELRLVP
jgi:hypothetical protein